MSGYWAIWEVYFRLAETPRVFADIDGWVRHRLRAVQLKQWKRGRVIYRELVACGMPPDGARRVAANSRRWWYNSAMALNMALPNDIFKRLESPNLPADLNPSNRPVRTRMPGGVAGDVQDKPPRPYADFIQRIKRRVDRFVHTQPTLWG